MSRAHRLDRMLEAGHPEGVDIMRRRALLGILDQAFLEDDRVGRR